MTEASTYRGESVRDALYEEIAWAKVEDLSIVQLRVHRSAMEGIVVATPITQAQSVWLAERKLLPVAYCEDSKRERLREVVLYPGDWAKLRAELLDGEYVAPRPGKGGMTAQITRVYGIPVVTFLR